MVLPQRPLLLLLLLVITTTSSWVVKVQEEATQCPSSWVSYSSSLCLWFSKEEEEVVWWRAWQKCRKMGSHLAYIESDTENNIISGMLADERITNIWLGLSDQVTEGSFVWADREPVQYTNFAEGEPVAHTETNQEADCVEMRQDTGYKWSVDYCFKKKRFACRLDLQDHQQEEEE